VLLVAPCLLVSSSRRIRRRLKPGGYEKSREAR
jgi:hypothetical protein